MGRRRPHAQTPAEIAARLMIPGRALHRLAARICSAKMLQRVVEPAIADFQNEVVAAASTRLCRRSWILLNGYLGVLEVIVTSTLDPSAISDEDARPLLRTFMWGSACMVSAGVLLIVLALSQIAYTGAGVLTHVGYVIPQALPIAVPIGLTLGIAFGLNGATASLHTRKVVLLAAFVASVIAFGTMAWVMPEANQSYRQALHDARGGRGIVTKGPNEMTFSELGRLSRIAQGSGQRETARRLGWHYHVRLALSLATLVLAVFALALADRRAGARRATVMGTCALYFLLLFAGEALTFGGLPPIAGAWLPNVIFAVTAAYLMSSRPPSMQSSLRPVR